MTEWNMLPKRTPDTMSDAIAQSSPNGRMSKRAREAAQERLRQALFGDGLVQAPVPQPSEREALLRQASDLRALAAHGVRPRAHIRKAEELEAKAEARTRAGTTPTNHTGECGNTGEAGNGSPA